MANAYQTHTFMHSGLSSSATVICFLASMQMEANCVFNVPQAILHPTAQASAMLLSACALDLAVAVGCFGRSETCKKRASADTEL